MTGPDTTSLTFIAFAKKDGEQGWTKLDDIRTIDPASLRDTGNVNTNHCIVPTSAAPNGQATGGAHGGVTRMRSNSNTRMSIPNKNRITKK